MSASPGKVSPSTVLLNGAFNVNSTSVIAWKHLFSSARGVSADGLTRDHAPVSRFPRYRKNPGKPIDSTDTPTSENFAAGHRELDDRAIEKLAVAMVEEVKRRGPFLSISDFVNRRLTNDPVSVFPQPPSVNACGTPAAAIAAAALNRTSPGSPLPRDGVLPESKFIPAHRAPTRHDGLAGIFSASDLLRTIGPALASRGDTFLIRVFVETPERDATTRLEMLVQRIPAPVRPDPNDPENPDTKTGPDFGRRIIILSRRHIN